MDFYYLTENKDTTQIYIFGDIVQSDLSARIRALDTENIEVYINSYGGEVAQGLDIYHALKQHKACVSTICTGFACSSASVIFMAGDTRKMLEGTILMIHNAWTFTLGDHKELNRQAENLEKISNGIKNIYEEVSKISFEELSKMMDEESYLNVDEALELGFATEIVKYKNKERNHITNKILQKEKEFKTEEQSEGKSHFMRLFNFN